MTESEAIEKLKNMRLFMQIIDKNSEHKFAEDDYKTNDMAIKALEEVQQYREIGTLEECRTAREKQIPKKPIKSEKQVIRYVNTYCCPICNLEFTGTGIAKWCYHCGQKLDWGDSE